MGQPLTAKLANPNRAGDNAPALPLQPGAEMPTANPKWTEELFARSTFPPLNEIPDDPNLFPVGSGWFPYQGDQYHLDRQRLSSSNCKAILNDPEKFRRRQSGEPDAKGDALEFGTVVSELFAYPDDPHQSPKLFFADVEKPDRRTKVGKATFDFAVATAAGRTIVWLDTWETAKRCAARLRSHAAVAEFHKDGDVATELAMQAILGKEFGSVPAKCMFDWCWVNTKDKHIFAMDVKTSHDPSPQGFRRQVLDFGYHIQEAFYRLVAEANGYTVAGFLFAVVGNDEAAYPAVYELEQSFLDMAYLQIREACKKYQESKTGEFDYLPDWSHGVNKLALPAYAKHSPLAAE